MFSSLDSGGFYLRIWVKVLKKVREEECSRQREKQDQDWKLDAVTVGGNQETNTLNRVCEPEQSKLRWEWGHRLHQAL